jgi:hypothetical protein
MRAGRAGAKINVSAQTEAVEPGMSGSTSTGAGSWTRIASRVAVALALLTVGLGVATVVMTSRADGWTLPGALWVTVGVPFSVMGALICARRPWNRIGWLMLAAGLSSTAFHFASWYVTYGRAVPARWLVTWIVTGMWVPAFTAMMFLLLLYPTGRLVSRRWRPVAWAGGAWGILGVTAVMAVNSDLAGPDLANLIGLHGAAREFLTKVTEPRVGLGSFIVLLLISLLSLVVRFRRARGVERQQLKWLVYAASLAIPTAFFLPLYWLTWGVLPWLSVCAIPVAIGVAVLRYHLYEIDRLINRTLVYGLLTVTLGLGYAAMVLLLGQLFGGIGDQPPSWVIAVATLVVAALVQPARRRIQRVVDRRFNRRRYDATMTIEAFTVRLREQIDLDTLTAELLAVVNKTMEPTTASVWLPPPTASVTQPALARRKEPPGSRQALA